MEKPAENPEQAATANGEGLSDLAPVWIRDGRLDLTVADRFNVLDLVVDLVALLMRAPTPFTISLSGAWGVGKSAVAETARLLLERSATPVCYVDAWTQDTGSMRRTIVVQAGARLLDAEPSEIAERIDARLLKTISTTRDRAEFDPRAERLKQAWKEHPRLFWSVGLALIGLLGLVVLASIFSTDPETAGQWFWDLIRVVTAGLVGAGFTFFVFRSGLFLSVVTENETTGPPAAVEVALADEFRRLVAPDEPARQKVVVIVDNLDRLQAKDALNALAEIRALVEIDDDSRCLFLIPIDREAFVEQLAESLGGPEAARDYLDKFFNLDLQLLAPSPVQVNVFAVDRADQIGWTEAERDAALRVIVAGANTPRYVTRVLNGAATRQYLLRKVPDRPSLELLTLVEVLATTFPDLGRFLAADPLTFVEERRRLLETSDVRVRARISRRLLQTAVQRRRWAEDPGAATPEEQTPAAAAQPSATPTRPADWGPAAAAVDRLQRFLAATHFVDASPEAVQMAALLRADPIWHGVQGAVALRKAMHAGDSAAFEANLPTREEDRIAALQAAVNEIDENLADGQYDLAFRGVGAAATRAGTAPGLASALYGQAIEVVTGIDTAELVSAPPTLVGLVARTDLARPAQGRRLWTRIADAASEIAQADGGRFGQLIPIAIAGLPLASNTATAAAATAFENGAYDDLGPLFDPKATPGLVSANHIARYAGIVSGWDNSGEDNSEVNLAIARLSALRAADWDGASVLGGVAADLAGNLGSYEPDTEDSAVLAAVVGLFANLEATEQLDVLAVTLLERAKSQAQLAVLALRLPFTDVAKDRLRGVLAGFLSATYGADDFRLLAEGSVATLERLGVDMLANAATRWTAAADASFLDVAMDRGGGGDACFRALATEPPGAGTMTLAIQLASASLARRRTGLLKRLTVEAVKSLAALPIAAVPPQVELFVEAGHGADVETDRAISMTLAQGLKPLAAGLSDATSVGYLVTAGRALASPGAETELAIAAADRADAIAIPGIDPESLVWLVLRSRRAAATRLLQRAIETQNNLPALADAARATRGHLSSRRQLRRALLSAAAAQSARGPTYGIGVEQVLEPLKVVAEWVHDGPLRDDERAMVDTIATGPFGKDAQVSPVVHSLRRT